MSEQMIANQAINIMFELYTGLFTLVPEISYLLEEDPLSSYYKDAVDREFDFSGNQVIAKPDDYTAELLREKLQEKHIPFIERKAVEELHPLGNSVFEIRESDYENLQEAVAELESEQEQVNALFIEEEEELERTLEDAALGGGEEEKTAEEGEEAAPEDEVEEDEEDEGSNTKDKDKKKDKKKGTKATVVPPIEESVNYEMDGGYGSDTDYSLQHPEDTEDVYTPEMPSRMKEEEYHEERSGFDYRAGSYDDERNNEIDKDDRASSDSGSPISSQTEQEQGYMPPETNDYGSGSGPDERDRARGSDGSYDGGNGVSYQSAGGNNETETYDDESRNERGPSFDGQNNDMRSGDYETDGGYSPDANYSLQHPEGTEDVYTPEMPSRMKEEEHHEERSGFNYRAGSNDNERNDGIDKNDRTFSDNGSPISSQTGQEQGYMPPETNDYGSESKPDEKDHTRGSGSSYDSGNGISYQSAGGNDINRFTPHDSEINATYQPLSEDLKYNGNPAYTSDKGNDKKQSGNGFDYRAESKGLQENYGSKNADVSPSNGASGSNGNRPSSGSGFYNTPGGTPDTFDKNSDKNDYGKKGNEDNENLSSADKKQVSARNANSQIQGVGVVATMKDLDTMAQMSDPKNLSTASAINARNDTSAQTLQNTSSPTLDKNTPNSLITVRKSTVSDASLEDASLRTSVPGYQGSRTGLFKSSNQITTVNGTSKGDVTKNGPATGKTSSAIAETSSAVAKTSSAITKTSSAVAKTSSAITKTSSTTAEQSLYNKELVSKTKLKINEKTLKKIGRSTMRIVSSTVMSNDAEGGRMMNEGMEIASPYAKWVGQKFVKADSIVINRSIKMDLDQAAVVYSTVTRVSFDDAKTSLKDFAKGKDDGTLQDMQDFVKKMNQPDGKGLIEMVRGMSAGQWSDSILQMMNSSMISSELGNELLAIPKNKLTGHKINQLIKEHADNAKDVTFLKGLSGIFGAGNASSNPVSLLKSFTKTGTYVAKRIFGNNEAVSTFTDITRAGSLAYSTYRSGMKLTMAVLQRIPTDRLGTAGKAISSITARADALRDPLKAASGKITGKAGEKLQAGVSGAKGAVKNGASAFAKSAGEALNKTRAGKVIQTARSTATKVTQAISASFKATKIGSALSSVSAAAGSVVSSISGAVATAAAALGYFLLALLIVVIVIILISVAVTALSYDKTTAQDDTGMSAYITAQDTDIVQEVVKDLQEKNQEFNDKINNIGQYRLSVSGSIGFDANQDELSYDNSVVIFKDWDGNVLDPTHVNFNNTKAILAMATRFMPYVFIEPGDSASEETIEAYEEIKQHFIDYCDFLWAATHQIYVEEYHPGDAKYLDWDDSDFMTDENGICDMDGKTIWLPEGALEKLRTGSYDYDVIRDYTIYDNVYHYCDSCDSLRELGYVTGYGDYGIQLCSHGDSTSSYVDGWQQTTNHREVIFCHDQFNDNGGHTIKSTKHYSGGSVEDGTDWEETETIISYETCDDEESWRHCGSHDTCKHEEYQYVYHCGGHMSSVVYVTVGDLSRFADFGAAGDVDIDSIGVYPDESNYIDHYVPADDEEESEDDAENAEEDDDVEEESEEGTEG